MRESFIGLAYFVSAFLFIFGVKRMSTPPTARSGNLWAAVAMGISFAATLLLPGLHNFAIIAGGTVLGAAIGIDDGRTVKMTAMPQMVALFNGMGGATAALVSIAEFMSGHAESASPGMLASGALGALIGALSFTGSLVAFAKLQELISDRPLRFPFQMQFNLLLAVSALAVTGLIVFGGGGFPMLMLVTGIAALLGILIVLPIGGADMPVVIALLNSATGVAAALTGFVLDNQILIVAGALVGASGMLLTLLMAKAMNRPISNVLFSGFGEIAAAGSATAHGGTIKSATADDVAVALVYARTVVIVPGYGLAVAQAQHTVRELADELHKRGVNVRFAIHPVAGRMPGHMNVVLADANVPYEQLIEMESINGDLPSTEMVLVIGANDVVNPAARSDPSSPIYGMPILDVDKARNVIVLKRSMNPGFAGIDNELFYRDNTRMLFGDAKALLLELVRAVKSN